LVDWRVGVEYRYSRDYFFPHHPDRLSRPPNLLSSRYRRIFSEELTGRSVSWPLIFNECWRQKKTWLYTSTSP
jgi:hypothetical protein